MYKKYVIHNVVIALHAVMANSRYCKPFLVSAAL